MKLVALGKNIVIHPIRSADRTLEGILLPQSQFGYEDGAVVLSVGPLVEDLAPGDVVVRPDPPLYEIVDDATKEELWLTCESDILAKIVPDDVPDEFIAKAQNTVEWNNVPAKTEG